MSSVRACVRACVCVCVGDAVSPPSAEQDAVIAGGNAHPGWNVCCAVLECVCESARTPGAASASGSTRRADPAAGVWLLLRIVGRTGCDDDGGSIWKIGHLNVYFNFSTASEIKRNYRQNKA